MKTPFKLINLLFLSLIISFNISCSDDDDDQIPEEELQNIVEIALETSELTSLVAALQAADGNLIELLSSGNAFTVLAPTNAAFTAFLAANNFSSLEEVPTDVLAEILLNHVISANLTSTDLSGLGSGYTSTNAAGSGGNNISVYFDTSSGVRFNNVAAVTVDGADIPASNGTIHIIDAVIPIPGITDHAVANPDLSSLVVALGLADGDLIDVISGEGPFTILAPDNDAFTTYLDGTPVGDVNTAVLSQLLLNHVLNGTVTAANLQAEDNGYTSTSATGPGMNPLSLYFNTTGGVLFNGTSEVTTADIVGTNGVIHVIDNVIDLPTVVTFAAADPNFSTLVDALTTLTPGTDFVNILSRTEGSNADGINPEYTVFAPTNAAFDMLAEIPEETVLTQVLLHHVISEANVRSGDLTPNGDTVAATLEGDNITITLPGTGDNIADVTDGSGTSDIGIIAVDVQATNGIIHVLNKVMIPDTMN